MPTAVSFAPFMRKKGSFKSGNAKTRKGAKKLLGVLAGLSFTSAHIFCFSFLNQSVNGVAMQANPRTKLR